MEAEVSEINAHNLWNQVFAVSLTPRRFDGKCGLYCCAFFLQQIRRDSMNNDHTTIEASKPENRIFNRYRDVYPYDHSRVVLWDCEDTDYINASLVQVLSFICWSQVLDSYV